MLRLILISLMCYSPWLWSVPVFKTPDSKWASGDIPPRELKADGLVDKRDWVKTAKGWIPRHHILTALDLSKKAIVETETLWYSRPSSRQQPKGTLKKGSEVQILKSTEAWSQIFFQNQKMWVHEQNLKPHPRDGGLLFTKSGVTLYLKPSFNSKPLGFIPEKTFLQPLQSQGHWFKVEHKYFSGWVSSFSVISKLDFIQSLTDRNGSKHTNTFSISDLAKIKEIEIKNNIAFVSHSKTHFHDLPMDSQIIKSSSLDFARKIDLIDQQSTLWAHTYTRESGAIWWPLNISFTENEDKEISNTKKLTINELVERGLFDIATHPSISLVKIASASGIFKTTDGENWVRLKEFGDQNFPVAISQGGVVFVGSLCSRGENESFQPCLRWDKIISKISHKNPDNLTALKILKLNFNEKNELIIGLKINKQNVSLVSKDLGGNWSYLKN